MITLYGIPNCDTMKKARRWLQQHDIEYRFHDYKKSGIDIQKLNAWIDAVGWETLLNRRGMMWRKTPQQVRDAIDEQSAIQLMLETPSIIKRPVLEMESGITVGFTEERYQQLLAS
ncbi:MAG: ArsC family reductase [Pseudomonadota bacterium]